MEYWSDELMGYWGSWGSGEHRQAAGASRLAACAPQKQNEYETEASAGGEWF